MREKVLSFQGRVFNEDVETLKQEEKRQGWDESELSL